VSENNKEEGESSFSIQLEEPPREAASSAGEALGTLFPEDSMVLTSAKLTALESLMGLLTRDLKFTDFMRELLLVFMRVVKCEAGSIFELDQKNQYMFFRAAAGRVSERLSSFTVPFGQGIVGYVCESKQPLVVNNVQENEKFLRSIQDAVDFETKNMVALPIMIRGRVFGALELINRVGEDEFSPSDVYFLSHLCEFVAKAIEIRLMLAWALQGKKIAVDVKSKPPREAA
jgi:GAF domain-containing protein